MWLKRTPVELRERGEEVPAELGPRLRPALQLGRHPAPPVVDGVVAAPQDPVVLGEPVVVELVGDVGQALAVAPADRRQLRRRERLGHHAVVVDRHDVVAQPAQQRLERVGAQGDPAARTLGERRRRPPRRRRRARAPSPWCPRRSARRAARRPPSAPTPGGPGRPAPPARSATARRRRWASRPRRASPRRRATGRPGRAARSCSASSRSSSR